jgi:hypothetical protein
MREPLEEKSPVSEAEIETSEKENAEGGLAFP